MQHRATTSTKERASSGKILLGVFFLTSAIAPPIVFSSWMFAYLLVHPSSGTFGGNFRFFIIGLPASVIAGAIPAMIPAIMLVVLRYNGPLFLWRFLLVVGASSVIVIAPLSAVGSLQRLFINEDGSLQVVSIKCGDNNGVGGSDMEEVVSNATDWVGRKQSGKWIVF